jgi:hypothetical protein
MIAALKIARKLLALAPAIRDAVKAMIEAFRKGDEPSARKAYEAARRAAFDARQ